MIKLSPDESGVFPIARPIIRCSTCHGPVEPERRTHAIPTCHVCLPPPPPIPIVDFDFRF